MTAKTFRRPIDPPPAGEGEPAWIGRSIPRPPSVNGLYRNNKNRRAGQKGRVRTTRYDAWCSAAGWQIRAQGPLPVVSGQYELVVLLGRRRGSDLDNYVKGLSDYLKHLGVIRDDSLCEDLRVKWSDDLTAKDAFFFIRQAPIRAAAPEARGVAL